MFPLILLGLGLGAALITYEFSPHARKRLDDYVRAIQEAHAAHRAADGHLVNAVMATRGAAQQHAQFMIDARAVPQEEALRPLPSQFAQFSAPPPEPSLDPRVRAAQVAVDAGVDHAIAATLANQQAAQKTVDAVRNARTGTEQRNAADSAALVLEREKKIEEALTSLGVGQCGVRSYSHVTSQIKDIILTKLHTEGMTVTGDNPWNVDTQQAGVKLRAAWDPKTEVLKLIVTASALYASCSMIWARIDPTLRDIMGMQAPPK